MTTVIHFRPDAPSGTWVEWRDFKTLEGATNVFVNLLDKALWCDVNGDGTRYESWYLWEWLRDTKRPNN